MRFACAAILCFLSFCAVSQYSERIPINSVNQADSTREAISQYVFGNEQIPPLQLDITSNKLLNVFAVWYSDNHLGGFETGTIKLKNGFTSKICFFHPTRSNGLNIPIIYHTGHAFGMLQEDLYVNYAISDSEHVKVIDFFLEKGFDVIGIDMPFYGLNVHPDSVTENGMTTPMYGHNQLFNLVHPFYYFLAPVRSVVNFLEERGYEDIVMLGLSGGGWTTTVYSAIDPRIKMSFPIAGSIPLPVRTSDNERGDLEQYLPDFYDRFNYTTLYFLGASGEGRRQFQILNKYDHCCFRLDGNGLWVDTVRAKLKQLNDRGTYGFYLDTLPHTHRISPVAVDSIQANIIRFIANDKLKNLSSVVSSKPDNIICEGDNLILSLTDTSGNDVVWYNGSGGDTSYLGTSIAPTTPGNYYPLVKNISGAEAYSDTIEVNQRKILQKPEITQQNGRLQSSFDGESHWWRDGVLLTDSGQSITAGETGMYIVQSMAGNCTSDLSDPFILGLRVYQENNSSTLNVQVASEYGNVHYALYNSSGLLIEKGMVNGIKRIHLSPLSPAGVYFLKFNGNKFSTIKKVLIR